METVIKEERYILQIGSYEHILRVQELLNGVAPWPDRFRVQLVASHAHPGKTIYAASAEETVMLAATYLAASPDPLGLFNVS